MRILLIEPNIETAYILQKYLSQENYEIELAKNKKEALINIINLDFDLIITELDIPRINGLDIIKKVRQETDQIPILIISENKKLETKIKAFNLGADDFLVKPICIPELCLRMKALIRRTNDPEETKTKFIIDDLYLNSSTKEVKRAGKNINLRRKEFELLEFLIRNKNKVINRSTILEYVWDYNINTLSNTVDVHIKHLRSKIDKNFTKKLIRTVHGVGYKISASY